MQVIPTNLADLAVWLTGAGAAAWIVSFLAERSAGFQALPATAKFYATMLIFIALPVVGILLQLGLGTLALPVAMSGWLQVFGQAVLQGFVAWVFSQYAHHTDPARSAKKMSDPPVTHIV